MPMESMRARWRKVIEHHALGFVGTPPSGCWGVVCEALSRRGRRSYRKINGDLAPIFPVAVAVAVAQAWQNRTSRLVGAFNSKKNTILLFKLVWPNDLNHGGIHSVFS